MAKVYKGEKIRDVILRLNAEIQIIENRKKTAEETIVIFNNQKQDRVKTIQLLKLKENDRRRIS